MSEKKSDKLQVINVKMDNETKSKIETLAFIKRLSLQDLCLKIFKDAIVEHAEVIDEVESKRE